METRITYCRNCQSACGMEVDVEHNRIVAIRGDKKHPISQGYSCIKGQYSKDLHNGEDRLLHPLKKVDGEFAEVPTGRALEESGAKLRQILDQHGPRAIGLYCGTAIAFAGVTASMAKTWLAGVGSPELYSNFTVDQSAKWVAMGRLGAFVTGKHMADDVDVMLLLGYNPLVSHMGYPLSPIPAANPGAWMDRARARGAKILVVDPRRTETAARADMHLAIRPSEDATLVAAIIREVLENGWHDHAFCARYVISVDKLKSAVAPFTLEYAAQRTGLSEQEIRGAVTAFCGAKRKVAAAGTGSNMCAHSNLVEHLVESLNAICGNYRRAGDPLHATGAIFGMVGATEGVMAPARSWEREPFLRSERSGRINGEFPSTRLPDEILHPENPIRALVVVGGNPATALADSDRVQRALASLELLVVLDPRMSETARLADYVIPTKLPYERADFTGYADNWFYRDFAQYAPPVIEAPEGLLDDWEVFWELARLMGTPLPFKAGPYGAPRDWLPEICALDPNGPRPTTNDLIEIICARSHITFDALQSNPSGLCLDDNRRVAAAPNDDGARLDVAPDDVVAELKSLLNEQGSSADFPYRLITRRNLHLVNSAFKNAGRVRKNFPVAPIYMNPDDCAAEGLSAADVVDLVSPHGRLTGAVVFDRNLRRGAVSMSACWNQWRDDAERTSLTSAVISAHANVEAINFMPLQSGTNVRVQRAQ